VISGRQGGREEGECAVPAVASLTAVLLLVLVVVVG